MYFIINHRVVKASSHFINHLFHFKNNHFYNNSSTDVIIKRLENYSYIRANVKEFSYFKFLQNKRKHYSLYGQNSKNGVFHNGLISSV